MIISGVGTAPKLATSEFFNTRKPEPWEDPKHVPPIPEKGILCATVPGVFDGIMLALEKYGTMSFAQVVAPALERADGFPMTEVFSNYIRANELIEKASPYLLEISRGLGETANLHELDGSEIVFVARFPGQHLFNIDIVVGSRLPAFFTASGTAILSRLSEADQREILGRTALTQITPYTQTDPAVLMKRVRRAGEKGYAIITNETVMGDIAVAAAITDEHGRAVAAINISVPISRWTPEKAEAELAQHVQVAATSISKAKFAPYRL